MATLTDGDTQAFDTLVGPCIDGAFALALGLLHDRGAAEDAVQEAAVKAWRHLRNVRSGAPVRPWFFGIVANQCREQQRGRWWSVVKLGNPEPAAGRDAAADVARDLDLRRALRSLRMEQRLPVVLHFYLDLPLEEVAVITGAPLGTVKSRLHRAMEQVRSQLGPQLGPEETRA